MKVLVLGASGMLGNAVMRVLGEVADWRVTGTLRSESAKRHFTGPIAGNLISGIDVEQQDSLLEAFAQVKPDIVINCIGVVKQLAEANDPLRVLPINAILPHRLARICELASARLIHISTDCVYSGDKGRYRESDTPDARDLYGRSKLLGEVAAPHTLTFRTSIIGHELQSTHGLVEWFLAQQGRCNGYAKVIYSGFPAVVLAGIMRDVVIPRPDLSGIFHLASRPITKYELLRLIAKVYDKKIEIVPDERYVIDRSLDATRFERATGYAPPEWEEMIAMMYRYR